MAVAANVPSSNFKSWPVILALSIVSLPLVIMYVYLFVDTVTDTAPGSLIPTSINSSHWDFLWRTRPGKAPIWQVAFNTLIFATSTTAVVLAVSATSGYVLSRLNVPARGFFLAGVMVLHAFPS